MKRGATTGRTALLGAALGLALAAVLVGPLAIAGLVPARGDLADFFWPMKAYTASRWAAGSLPLWNPLAGCGEPWLAQLQSGVLNPFDLPFLLGGALGPDVAIALLIVVAAAGTAAWLVSLGSSRAGALAAAAVYTGGGAFLSLALVYNNFATAAFLPWMFLGARRAVRGASVAGFAAAVALAFLGGEPALAAAGALAASAVALAARREDAAGRDAHVTRATRPAVRLVGALALGIGLAGAALLPFAALLKTSGRIAGAARAEAFAQPVGAADLADLVLPPASAETRHALAGRGGYVATLALAPFPFVLAAAAGAGFAARPRLLACLAALAALGLLLSLGERGLLMPLLWEAGVARGLRFPARWFVFAHLALAAAAGAGLDGWRDGHLRGWPKTAAHEAEPPPKTPLVFSTLLAGSALVALFVLAAAVHRAAALAAGAALAALAAGLALLACVRVARRPRRSHAGALLVACVALPLPLGTLDLFAGAPAAELGRAPRILADLAPGGPGRVFAAVSDGALLRSWMSASGPAWTPDTALRAHEALAGYAALGSGVASASSPSPIGNPWRTRLFGAALSGGDAGVLLGLADVRRIVTPFAAAIPGAWLERRAGSVLRYTLAHPLGRVFFAKESVETGDDAAFASLVSGGFDPEERALLAPGSGRFPPRRAGKGFAVAKVTRDDPERLEVDLATSDAAALVVTRSWDAGWEARIDGAPAALRRCDLAFMAVAVPAGEHRLALLYRPWSFRAGVAVSCASLLVLAGLVLAGRPEPAP